MSITMDNITKPEPMWKAGELITVKLVCPKCGFVIEDVKFPESKDFLKPDRYENRAFQGKRYALEQRKYIGIEDIIKQNENNAP